MSETQPTTTTPSADEQHNLALILTASSLITGILGPLIMFLVFKDKNPLVDKVGKKVLNVQITLIGVVIAFFIVSLLCGIIFGAISTTLAAIIGVVLMLVLVIIVYGVNILITIKVANKKYDDVKVPFFTLNLLK